jgi:signal transduction histidine kinase
MKVRFSQRLNTRLSLFPLFIILVVFIAGGIGFYVFGYSHFLKDFHKLHLINLSSDKKLIMDSWFQYYKTDLEDLSRLDIFRSSAAILMKDSQKSPKGRKAREAFNEAQLNISRLFEEKTSSKKYNALFLLSMDGRVVSSSRNDLVGADWSDRTFLREMAPVLKSTAVAGFGTNAGADNGIDFITPVFDAQDNMIAILYASSKFDDLTGFLKIKNGLYKSEKIDLIDRDGNIVLTREGAYAKKIRYNIPRDSQNIVQYKDGIFFYMADLEQAPFRLIATVKKSEVARPFTMLLIMYLSFAGAVILLTVIQNAFLAKRLITRPVSKLINAVKSVVAGDLSVDIGKDYRGEFLDLKKSFENMIEELRERESNLRENIRTKEQSRLRSMVFGKMSHELRTPLNTIVHGAGAILDTGTGISQDNRRTLEEILSNGKNLLQLMDDLLDLSRLEDGKLTVSPEEFNMCELLKEVEDTARNVIGTREIELVVDCQDVFLDKPVYTDRQRLRQILTNLVTNAVISTEVGTVTVLCSEAIKNNIEYLEVSVADTGAGIEPEKLDSIFYEFSDYPMSSGLFISKKLTDALGGRIDAESAPGKGSVFTITIPIKAIVYQ